MPLPSSLVGQGSSHECDLDARVLMPSEIRVRVWAGEPIRFEVAAGDGLAIRSGLVELEKK